MTDTSLRDFLSQPQPKTEQEKKEVIPINSLAVSDTRMRDTLALIAGTQSATDMNVTDKFNILILGDSGSGKSVLATTARPPILMFVLDNRQLAVAGKPNVTIKVLNDKDDNHPTAWSNLESDVNSLIYLYSKDQLSFKTIVLDPLTFLLEAAKNQMIHDTKNTYRTGKIGAEEYNIQSGWDAINYQQAMVMRLLDKLFSMQNVDLILTAHEGKEKAPDYTEKEPKFTGKVSVNPNNMKILFSRFNERWRMLEGFKVQMKPNYNFNAVTALNVDAEEQPNIQDIIAKHVQRTGAK